MRYVRSVRILLVASLSVCGCAFPEFDFVPSDSALADTSVSADVAAGDTGVVILEDTSTDTLVSEATVVDTAAMDTPADAPRTGCAAALHDYCVDWDSSTEPTFGWSAFYLNNGGKLAVDPAAFSPTRSLLTTLPAGGGVGAAAVSRALVAPADDTLARIDLRVRFDAPTYAGSVMLVKLQRENHGASIWMGSGGLFYEAFGVTYRSAGIPRVVTPGTWHHLRLEANLKTSAATVRVFVDDMSMPAVAVNDVSTVLTLGKDRQLAVGPYVDATSYGAWSVRYDDVSLDWL